MPNYKSKKWISRVWNYRVYQVNCSLKNRLKSIWRVYSQVAVKGLRSTVLICLLAPPFHSLRCTHLINPRGLFPSFNSIVHLLRRAPSRAQWHLFSRSMRPKYAAAAKLGHLLIRMLFPLHCSLVCLLHTACFAHTLHYDHLLARWLLRFVFAMNATVSCDFNP